MLNTRLAVVRQVTEQITDLERELDAVFIKHAQLQIALVNGRRTANLPLNAGQAGLERLAEASASLIAARAAVHEAHYEFRAVRDELRLPAHAYGDGGDTPDKSAARAAADSAAPLALVHAA